MHIDHGPDQIAASGRIPELVGAFLRMSNHRRAIMLGPFELIDLIDEIRMNFLRALIIQTEAGMQ
jgi:hypothetical protein